MTRTSIQWIHESGYAAKVPITLVEDETGWSPYVAPADLAKLDRVRAALKAGNTRLAAQEGAVFKLAAIDDRTTSGDMAAGFAEQPQTPLKGEE